MITKPPIRPVGFRNRDLAAILVYAATVIQMLVAGLTAIYFYDLRRYDWTTQVTTGDAAFDLMGDFLESTFPLESLPRAWWSVLLLTKLLYWFTAFMLVLNLIPIFSPITLQAIALSGTVVAGILQIDLIRRLIRRQASLFQRRMRAVEKAEAAGEPIMPATAG
jgi:hypothetical protein